MTVAAVWKVSDRIYAVADTRLSRERGNVLTEHGPKLLPLSVVCKQPGPSGFFDREKYRTTIGFAYAGSSLAGLATHALANILFQSLAGAAESLPPGLDQLAEAVSQIGLQYMREVGILGGDKALFQGIVFGFCGRENRFRAFKITPNLDQDVHVVRFRARLSHDWSRRTTSIWAQCRADRVGF
jgi:hypothetical protein